MIFKVCRRRQNITLFSFLFTFLVQDAIENRHKTRSFLVKMRRVMATVPKIGKELQKLDFGKLDGRKKSIFGGFWESVGNLKLAENGDRSLGSIDSRRVPAPHGRHLGAKRVQNGVQWRKSEQN